MNDRHLEVLVTGVGEALAAQSGGASRVELVVEFERDGLTPPDDLIDAVARAVSIPVNVMLRPHDRGYVYSYVERQALIRTAARMRDLGASAIVFGALDEHAHVASDVVREIVLSSGLPITFHRAFDATPNPSATYATLAAISGVERVLTSGSARSAWDGRYCLRELCAGDTSPIVLAGGGVTLEGLLDLASFTGVREIHVGSAVRTGRTVDAKKVEQFVAVLSGDLEGTLP